MVSQQTPGRGNVGKKHVTPARTECLRVEDEEEEGECDGVGASFHTKLQALTQSPEDTNVLGVQQDAAYITQTKTSHQSGHGDLVLSPPQFVVKSATFHEPVPYVAHDNALAPSNWTVTRGASGAHPGAPQPAQLHTHFDHPEALVVTRQGGAGQGGGNNSPSSTPLATTKQAPQPSAATREMKAAKTIEGAVRYRLARITLGLMRERRRRLSEQEAMAEVMSKCESVRERELKRAGERASERGSVCVCERERKRKRQRERESMRKRESVGGREARKRCPCGGGERMYVIRPRVAAATSLKGFSVFVCVVVCVWTGAGESE